MAKESDSTCVENTEPLTIDRTITQSCSTTIGLTRYTLSKRSQKNLSALEELQRLWPHGHSSTGEATFESAAYIARYCVQKITGDEAEEHYKRFDYLGEYQLTPEFNQMSRKPGIGGDWLKFYKEDVFKHDIVVINGKETNVPKFYDKLLKKQNPERLQDLKDAREWNGYQQRADNTPERLLIKEIVTKAKIQQLERGKV